VIALEKFDCDGLVVQGRSPLALLALFFFLARWCYGCIGYDARAPPTDGSKGAASG
jgi:hypothetical protein